MRLLKKRLGFIGVVFLGGAYFLFYFLNRQIKDGYGTWLYTQLFNLNEPKIKNIFAMFMVLLGLTTIFRYAEIKSKFSFGGSILFILAGILLRIPVDFLTNALPLGVAAPIWVVPIQRVYCNFIYLVFMIFISLFITENFKLNQIKFSKVFLALVATVSIVTIVAYTIFAWKLYGIEQFAVDYVTLSIEMGDTIRGYAPQDFYNMYRGILTRRLLIGCYFTTFVVSLCAFLAYLKICKTNCNG